MLCSGFIGEIFCRMAYLEGPIPSYQVPSEAPGLELPPLLISASASSAEKLWPTEKWVQVLTHLKAVGLDVGLLGAGISAQRAYWTGADTEAALIDRGLATDFRGLLSLPQVVGALCGARAVLTLDNGIMHLAAATRTPIVALFRNGYDRLWAPPERNLTCVTAAEGSTVAEIDVCEIVEACTHAF
jgi:ADP-heptose:LPS heptosyltransferase